jgi:hypothetical protein
LIFEIDEKTGMIAFPAFSLLNSKPISKYPPQSKDLEKIFLALKTTQEKIGRKPNYEKGEEYYEMPVIIYDELRGFLIQDIRMTRETYELNPKVRVPSPDEVKKFLKYAKIACAKQFQETV